MGDEVKETSSFDRGILLVWFGSICLLRGNCHCKGVLGDYLYLIIKHFQLDGSGIVWWGPNCKVSLNPLEHLWDILDWYVTSIIKTPAGGIYSVHFYSTLPETVESMPSLTGY